MLLHAVQKLAASQHAEEVREAHSQGHLGYLDLASPADLSTSEGTQAETLPCASEVLELALSQARVAEQCPSVSGINSQPF